MEKMREMVLPSHSTRIRFNKNDEPATNPQLELSIQLPICFRILSFVGIQRDLKDT